MGIPRIRATASKRAKGSANPRTRGKDGDSSKASRGSSDRSGRPRGRSRVLGWVGLAVLVVLTFSLGGLWGRYGIDRLSAKPTAKGLGEIGREQTAGATTANFPSGFHNESSKALPLSGEFEAQSAIILGGVDLVRGYPKVFKQIVEAITRNTHLICLVSSEKERLAARAMFEKLALEEDAVSLRMLPMDTPWVRDFGPIFLRRENGSVAIADLNQANTTTTKRRWRDDDVPKTFGGFFGKPVVSVPLWMPGGNLLSNGDGLFVTTLQAVVASRPRIDNSSGIIEYNNDDVKQVSDSLAKHFGAKVWCYFPALKDEPTGHVDMFVTFTAPDAAVVGQCDPAVDPDNAKILDEAAKILSMQKTAHGRPVRVFRIPMPPRTADGAWRSYTNVVFANGNLLVPSYADIDPAVEKKAMALYKRLLPDWKIVPIEMDEMVGKQGYLHCVTNNVPAFMPLPEKNHLQDRRAPDS